MKEIFYLKFKKILNSISIKRILFIKAVIVFLILIFIEYFIHIISTTKRI